MDIDTSYKFCRVSDQLTTSGLVPTGGLKALASQGYQVVINLLPDTSEYAISDERNIVESQGIEYIYIPVDFRYPTLSNFAEFSKALDEVLSKKVHIHCAANYRVSVFYSLYERNRRRWCHKEAMSFIQNIWQPAEHPGWSEFIADVIRSQDSHSN